MKKQPEHGWLKNRGYLHITPKINIYKEGKAILSKVQNENYVAKHAFFPLIHSIIKERRYKRISIDKPERTHSYVDKEGLPKHHAKHRPLHYATHIDALIFGYYAELLQSRYEKLLFSNKELSSCITAYRKLQHESEDRNKNTVDFAHEAFSEISKMANQGRCYVMKFDIKSFFSSLDHKHLKKAWARLIEETTLPKSHFNVFKAATKFSYILLDDLRISSKRKGRKSGFNEKKLAFLRKKGVQAFFESPQEFRETIKEGKIKVYKNPFYNKVEKHAVGIPQGLPISATLANLYLYEFDNLVFNKVVKENNGYYRRYSDDIIIICKPNNYLEIRDYILESIQRFKVEIAKDKTEIFYFENKQIGNINKLTSTRVSEKEEFLGVPFTYLGFEHYGDKTLVKSANLAKFYRRMITSVKRRSSRAKKAAQKNLTSPQPLFKKQIYKLYSFNGKNKKLTYPNRTITELNEYGEFNTSKQKRINPKKYRGNYITYIHRASEVMDEPALKQQIRNHFKILKKAIEKHHNKDFI